MHDHTHREDMMLFTANDWAKNAPDMPTGSGEKTSWHRLMSSRLRRSIDATASTREKK